jgi:hypothetical protein
MTADRVVELRAQRRSEALSQILRLRRRVAGEAEFGRMAAPIIDALIADEAAMPPLRAGRWSDEERETLRAAFAKFDRYRAVDEAAKCMSRTRAQIRSMAGNMGLKL